MKIFEVKRPTLVRFRIIRIETAREGPEVCSGCIEAGALTDAGDRTEVPGATVSIELEPQELLRGEQRQVELHGVLAPEISQVASIIGHDPDDLERLTVQGERAPQHGRVLPEVRPPRAVPENRHGTGRVLAGLVGVEQPSQRCLEAEELYVLR